MDKLKKNVSEVVLFCFPPTVVKYDARQRHHKRLLSSYRIVTAVWRLVYTWQI